KDPGNKINIVEGDIIELETKNDFRKNIEFKISENSSAKWKMCYATWGKLNADKAGNSNWLFNQVEKYTENYSIKILNLTNKEIKIDTRVFSHKSNSMKDFSTGQTIFMNKEAVICTNREMLPYDRFE